MRTYRPLSTVKVGLDSIHDSLGEYSSTKQLVPHKHQKDHMTVPMLLQYYIILIFASYMYTTDFWAI